MAPGANASQPFIVAKTLEPFRLGCWLFSNESTYPLYNELIPRLRSIELAGEPSYMQTLFVGGPKHLPIRYELR